MQSASVSIAFFFPTVGNSERKSHWSILEMWTFSFLSRTFWDHIWRHAFFPCYIIQARTSIITLLVQLRQTKTLNQDFQFQSVLGMYSSWSMKILFEKWFFLMYLTKE